MGRKQNKLSNLENLLIVCFSFQGVRNIIVGEREKISKIVAYGGQLSGRADHLSQAS